MHPENTATTKNGKTGTDTSTNDTTSAATEDTMNTHKNASVANGECPIFFRKKDTLLFVRILVKVATRLISAANMAMKPFPSLPHNCVVNITVAKFNSNISTLASAV